MLTKLAQFFLAGWGGKQQGIINRPPQAKSCRDVPPQVGDDCLLVYNNSIRSRVGSICRQGDIHDAIREPVGGSALVKDERRMRCIAKRNWRCLRGARFGVCHDGSYRFWEWNDDLSRAFCSSGSLTPSPPAEKAPQPLRASRSQNNFVNCCFLDNRTSRGVRFQKKPVFTVGSLGSSWGAGGAYEYRRQPPHGAVPTLDDRNAGRETVGTAATGVNR